MEYQQSPETWHRNCNTTLAMIAVLWSQNPEQGEFWNEITRRLEMIRKLKDTEPNPEYKSHLNIG